MADCPESQPLKSNSTSGRFFGRRIVFGLTLLIALAVSLPFSAAILVVPSPTVSADVLFIGDIFNGACYRPVIQRWRDHQIQTILLWSEERKRVVLLGADAPIEEHARRKLMQDGLPAEAMEVVPGSSRSQWETARLLVGWLKNHPDQQVCVVCALFSSRRWSTVLDQVLDSSDRARVVVEGAPDPDFNATNWWRSRKGIKAYFHGLYELAYVSIHGEDQLSDIDWSPEKFEAMVLDGAR